MARRIEEFNIVPEKRLWIPEDEYHNLLIIKGKYEELKEITDKIFSLLTPNKVKEILKFNHILNKKEIDKNIVKK